MEADGRPSSQTRTMQSIGCARRIGQEEASHMRRCQLVLADPLSRISSEPEVRCAHNYSYSHVRHAKQKKVVLLVRADQKYSILRYFYKIRAQTKGMRYSFVNLV